MGGTSRFFFRPEAERREMDPLRSTDSDELPAHQQARAGEEVLRCGRTDLEARKGRNPIATPVFDGATQTDVDRALMGWALPIADPAGDPLAVKMPISLDNNPGTHVPGRCGCSTAVRVSLRPEHQRWATCTFEVHHLVDDKSTLVPPARTRWSRSSRWVARRSSAASVSARWRCGLWSVRRRLHPAGDAHHQV